MSETTSNHTLRCVIVTPEQTVLDTTAEFVALPLYDGELGVGLHHSPMIGRLGYGELRIRTDLATTRFYVEGGFVQIADNLISVLTNRSLPAEKVDADQAREQLSDALGHTTAGEEQIAIRDRTIAQARAQIRVAKHASSV